MRHPFEKLFRDALRIKDDRENAVTVVVRELLHKGYPVDEVKESLEHFYRGTISERDRELLKEALDEMVF